MAQFNSWIVLIQISKAFNIHFHDELSNPTVVDEPENDNDSNEGKKQ